MIKKKGDEIMNENKVIPLRVMFFASLLFGFLASTIQDVYFKNLEGNMFIQWQENAFYIARLFCVVFAFFTIYISYTFTNLKFDAKKTLTKLFIINFFVCAIIAIVSILSQYSDYQMNILLFRYLFYCLFMLIICKIEEKLFL